MTDPVATIFYCTPCDTCRPIQVADMRPGTRHGQEGAWGDIICTVCRISIMTLQVSSPGLYAFKKMTENETSLPNTTHSPRWYCTMCKGIQAIGIEEMLQDEIFPENGIWGDIICMGCFSILSAVKVNEPGTYSFMKVGELAQRAALPEETHVPGTKWRKSSRVAAGSRRLSHASRPA
jgi:hypothetical protein